MSPPSRRRGPSPLQSVLGEQIRHTASQTRDPLLRARAAWFTVCGPHLARHSEPIGWDGPLLVIAVDGLQWREILFEQKGRLTGRLRRWLPQVRGIRLRRGKIRPPQERQTRPQPQPRRAETEEIADDALRESLDRLLYARDARRESKP